MDVRERQMPSDEAAGQEARVVVIFNPAARSALAGTLTRESLEQALHEHGIAGRIETSDSDDAASALAERASRAGARIVVATGGDGTVHAVARGLLRSGKGAATLGILPVGTMNNIARTLGIPEEVDGALAVIAEAETSESTCPFDIGSIDGELFLEVAGLGLLAELVPLAERVKGRPWRLLGASWEGMRRLLRFREARVTLWLDGRQVRTRARNIAICNTPMHGAECALTPDARIDDGLLDVVVYERYGGFQVLRDTLERVGGRRVAGPGIRRFRAREIRVAPGAPWPLQLDAMDAGTYGSGTGRPVAEVRVVPGALRVCAPQQPLPKVDELGEGALKTLLRAAPPLPVPLAGAAHAAATAAQEVAQREVESPHRAARRVSALRLLYLAGFGVAVVASVAARRWGVFPGDLALTRAVQRRRTPLMDRVMTAIAWAGFPPQSVATVVVPAAFLWAVRLRLEAVFMLLASGTDAFNFVLKRVICRNRPTEDVVRVMRIIREPSFPSGHVMHYLGVFGFLAAAALTNLRPSKLRAAIVGGCGALCALVGPTRVYLGAHWPSDVGAGYLFGGLWLGGLLQAYAEAKRRQAARANGLHSNS